MVHDEAVAPALERLRMPQVHTLIAGFTVTFALGFGRGYASSYERG
jgi:hypothetical protein